MSKTSTRKFWKYIKKFNNNKSKNLNNINLDEFSRYFENIYNTPHNEYNSETFTYEVLHVDQLDSPFTIDEIQKKTLRCLERNNSSDLNNIVADFFIDANTFISPYLCIIFNKIFDTGIYPQSWSKGFIVPVFKKVTHLMIEA